MVKHHEYLVIGAGPAGVQIGFYLQRHGRDYQILEGGDRAGAFYTWYPRHRMMISINKVYTGSTDPEFNMRHDWNSLLSEGEGPLFKDFTTDFFPKADVLVAYADEFVRRHQIRVKYDARVTRVSRQGDGFAVETAAGEHYTCARLIVASGLSRPNIPAIPGIELVEGYEDVSVDPADFINQRVLILGKGNSAFETAENLTPVASVIHLASPNSIRMAWKTHYVGDLRSVNNDILDTYQLKTQNAVLDAEVKLIERHPDGGFAVTFAYQHAEGEVEVLRYDRVIRCTGFRFDASIFDDSARPALVHGDRFPDLRTDWESVNQPGMYFAGTIMQAQGYRKSTSGFIHGFRYNVRTMAHLLAEKYHGEPLPSETLPFEPGALTDRVLDRVNRGSDIWQQQAYLADAILVRDDGTVEWRESLPVAYIRERHVAAGERVFVLTMEFGPHHDAHDPFNVPRARRDNVERAADSAFLHPAIREYVGGVQVAEHHVIEDLDARWEEDEHVRPLLAFFNARMGRVPVGRIVAESDALQPAAD